MTDRRIKYYCKLWQQCASIKSRNIIILYFWDYSKKLATEFCRKRQFKHNKEDLQSAALLGLFRAIDLHDVNSEAKFSSYAYIKIKGSMLDMLKAEGKKTKQIEKIKEKQKYSRRDIQMMQRLMYRREQQTGSILDDLCEREERNQFTL